MLQDVQAVEVEQEKSGFRVDKVRAFLARASHAFEAKPFNAHRLFRSGHAQTLAAYAWPRRFRFFPVKDQERLFEVEPGIKVLAHCRWQATPAEHSTLVIWHGIEGSTDSNYMLSTALKGFQAGFNIVRVNLRNCGGTEHLTPTLYHGGLSEDLRAVVTELIEGDHLSGIFLVGFSLGGNLVLKLAGEYGDNAPREILGVCAVSPSVDLTVSAKLITKRSNWIYQQDFVRRLKQRIRTKNKLFPELYDIRGLRQIRTLKHFDDRFTAPAHGFANAHDYYYRSSSIRVSAQIRIPTLIVHAHDDPFIPFAPLRDPAFTSNPYILLLGPERGGHVAFISATPASPGHTSDGPQVSDGRSSSDGPQVSDGLQSSDKHAIWEPKKNSAGTGTSGLSLNNHHSSPVEDRFWAENRVIEFCKLADEAL